MDIRTKLLNVAKGSSLSQKKLAEESGVNRISLMRFMRGETDLTLKAASRLAEYFGLELQPKQARKKGK